MFKTISYIISAITIVMCAGLAYGLFFTDIVQDKLFGLNRTLMGLIVVLYCLYRSFTLYTTLQKNKRDANN